jgi:hypothetical protein
MITATLLVVLGAALAVVLWAMFRPTSPAQVTTGPTAQQVPAANPIDIDPWDVRPGDVISISGAAADFSDVDLAVDRRSTYQSSSHRWVDLSGEFRGVRMYLEVYRHPQRDLIGILDDRKLALADLGVSEDMLTDMDSRQDPSSTVDFEGKKWQWESSREIRYFENDLGDGEGLYRWLFREPGGNRLICVEKWEDEPFDIRIARRLNPHDVTVYRATKGASV